MNLFARAVGGYISDRASARFGMRGRLVFRVVCLVLEGAMLLAFAHSNSLGVAIFVLVLFSIFVQACEGSTFGIVPYVNHKATGTICGIVGAGGNVGAVAFGLAFRQLDYYWAFIIMGCTIIFSSLLTAFISIKGYARLFSGEDSPIIRSCKLP